MTVVADSDVHVGTHSCYSQGCRTLQCREAHRLYELKRKRERSRPDGKGKKFEWVDATETRNHLRWLATKGAGYRQLGKITGVPYSTIAKIRSGRVTKIRSTTADKLLGVHLGLLISDSRKRLPTSVPHYHLNKQKEMA